MHSDMERQMSQWLRPGGHPGPGWSTRWFGRRCGPPSVAARSLAIAAALLLSLPVGAPVASAQSEEVDPVGCGMGVSAVAQTVTDPDGPEASTAPVVGGTGDTTPGVRAVAGITLIPPTAAAAGIASGARSFRTTAGTKPAYLTPFLGSLVFSARDDARGRELWIATPTTARRLRDIAPGAANSSPRDFVLFGERMFFTASDGTHGRELWRTDGTAAGTRMVKDIRPGARGSNPGALHVFEGVLYFVADDGTHGGELWRSDGTSAGTRLLKDIDPEGSAMYTPDTWEPDTWAVMGGLLYFPVRRRYGEVWRTDGTTAGTRRVVARVDLASPLVAVGDRLFFTASHDDGGCALDGPFLFTSDGTSAGTEELEPAGYPWGSLVAYRGRAWFGNHVERRGTISERPRLWRSAGTDATTVQARPAVAIDSDEPIQAVGGRLFMSIGGGLAASDDRGRNITVLGDTADGWRSTMDVVQAGSRWFFPAGQGRVRELWRTDGTPASTRLALNVNPSGNDAVGSLVSSAGVLWFVGDDGIRGPQVWRYVPSSR